MKKAYGITTDTLAPTDLIQAMLKAEVELIYFGGIGTYIKAANETNEEVGDRANEALRVNGGELRAKVIGEGANLGMTQRGRIEYALTGGHLNTDAIDNSAGVDTSDHEVNIKVLLRKAVDKKTLSIAARDKLLASMTDADFNAFGSALCRIFVSPCALYAISGKDGAFESCRRILAR